MHKEPMTAKGSLDLEKFSDKVRELIQLSGLGSSDTCPDGADFTHDEPTGGDPESITLPVITYDTNRRTRSASHKSLDPILFDRKPDPDRPGEFIRLYRMWFDTEIIFRFYHVTNLEARRLMEEFEEFIFAYKSFFKEIGISDIIFMEETKPQVVTRFNKSLPERSLVYLVRIERITTIRSNSLKEIGVVVEEPTGQTLQVNTSSGLMDHYNASKRL